MQMSDYKSPVIITEPLRAELKALLREVFEEMHVYQTDDRLLDADEAAKLLSVSPDWLYRNSRKLPFVKRIHPKMIRFSYQGIQVFIADRNRRS
jgi:predicted DNA-binding transcriptional regulator AlpA